MNLSRKNLIFLRNFFPLLFALTTFIIGYIGLYFYSSYDGKHFNKETNYQIINQLDSLFTSLQTIIGLLSSISNIKCTRIQPLLNKIVETTPPITSVTLLKDKQLYCTSKDSEKYQDYIKQLNRDSYNKTSTNPSIIFDQFFTLYIQNTTHTTVIVSIDNKALTNILKPRVPTQIITLELDNRVISFQGIVSESSEKYNVVESSSIHHFLYTLKTGFNKPSNLEILFFYHGTFFIIICLLTIIVYVVTRWIIENFSGAYFELDRAIHNNEIKAYVQPVYSAKAREVIGIEILMRWHHPMVGIILPDTFTPIAEQTGLIIPMTRQLFKQVGAAIAPYAHQIRKPFKIGFNISRVHCQNLDLIDDCKKFYDYLGTNDISLVIEITERELIEVTDTTKELFKELHKINALIALDDFGIGNSNLSYLYDFSVDYLKIDKSFVSRFGSDALSKNILDSIIEIALNCQLESCAEGVESEFQADYLSNRGVNYLQGFYFSPPLPIQDFIKSSDFKKILIS